MPRLQARTQSTSYLPTYSSEQAVGTTRGRLRTTSAVNLSVSEHVSPLRKKKLPLKTTSFQINRSNLCDSVLPEFNDVGPTQRSSPTKRGGRPPMRTSYRASFKGKGDVLPTSSFSSPARGYSTDSAWTRGQGTGVAPLESIKAMTQRLRSRRRTSSCGYENSMDSSLHMSDNSSNSHAMSRQKKNGTWFSGGNEFSSRSTRQRHIPAFSRLILMRKREWVQLFVVCTISFLVFDSYFRAVSTTERLDKFKKEEAMMMLHLQRIEQQSINLHENLARLGKASTDASETRDTSPTAGQADKTLPDSVDSNLIRVQTQQLYQMEEELDHELRALQTKLQNVARSNIIRTYGEGAIQVVLEMDFPADERSNDPGHDEISILLGSDTPHAAWIWLQQIQKGEWNGAPFHGRKSATIEASPVVANAGTIDFTEKSKMSHEAWTVGLSTNNGSLDMFINLQDNSQARKRDVCVGKVIDGFDALQRLVDVSRRDKRRPVSIKRATTAHMTRNQRQM